MKFADDGDRFGIILTPAGGRHFYQFRLIVGGQIIGDTHNCADPELDKVSETYVRGKHFPGGNEVDSTKGILNYDEDPYALADAGAGVEVSGPNARGFFERLVNARRIIGNASENSGGLPTPYYRIVQDRWGGSS